MDLASLGTIGIWRRHQEGAEGIAELEELGFGALWLGGSPAPADVAAVPRGHSHADDRDRHPQRLAPRAGRRRG